MPFAEAPGARLLYESVGAGTTIVFVHETSADRRSWEAQVRLFSRVHRCITFNARGYVPSSRSAHAADHSQMTDDIGHVMDAAGVDSAFIVGMSMGAYFTAHFALRHSDRVRGMVLAGLGAGADDPAGFRAGILAAAAAVRKDGMRSYVEQMRTGPNRVQLQAKDPHGWDEFIAHCAELDPGGVADVLEHCHARRPPIYETEAALRDLHVPTLVVVGDEDTGCIQPGLFLKRSLPVCGLWVCPKTGHAINLEEPSLFNSVVQDFICKVEHGAWKSRDPRSDGPLLSPTRSQGNG